MVVLLDRAQTHTLWWLTGLPTCLQWQTRPQEAAFVLSLLHPDPDCRPSVDAIVRSELLLALHKSIRQRKHSSGGCSYPHTCHCSPYACLLQITPAHRFKHCEFATVKFHNAHFHNYNLVNSVYSYHDGGVYVLQVECFFWQFY